MEVFIKAHTKQITTLALDNSELPALLLSSADDGLVNVFDLETKTNVNAVERKHVNAALFNQQNKNIIYLSSFSNLELHDLRAQTTLQSTYKSSDEINAMDYHSSGNYTCIADDSGQITVIDCRTFMSCSSFNDKHSNISSVVKFRPDKPFELWSGGYDCQVKKWDFTNGLINSFLMATEDSPLIGGQIVNPPFVHDIALTKNEIISALGNGCLSRLGESKSKRKKSFAYKNFNFQGHNWAVSQLITVGNDLISGGIDGKVVYWNRVEDALEIIKEVAIDVKVNAMVGYLDSNKTLKVLVTDRLLIACDFQIHRHRPIVTVKPRLARLGKKQQNGQGIEKGASRASTTERSIVSYCINNIRQAPEYLKYRIDMFDRLKQKQDELIAAQPRLPIKITLPDSRIMDGTSYETTPMDIAKLLSKSLAERAVISKVDGKLWDLIRPFENSCSLEILDFENDEGRSVFWHSSAHVLGEACELNFACHLCNGPPVEDGFYYDMAMSEAVVPADYENLEALAKKAIAEKQPFVRLEMTKEELLEMFQYNKYKCHFIREKVPDNTSTTVYRCGPLIDLCLGPHVPDTGRIKAFSVTKSSAAYFLGDAKNDSLQRVYGVSFPDQKQMKEHKKFLEEASKRDHRKIGIEQDLFFFHELSPGSCFFLPNGARIYNTLIEFQRSEYRKRGFSEVVSPNIYNTKLWEISGHWQNYQENMFAFEVEKEKFALKPMNCPGHCLMFKHSDRSYRDLPIRMADFGVLHRNEYSGALTGLTRVRRFQQDDAHIFCRVDQLGQEMEGCLDFLKHIYGIFGFSFSLKLSTRPEKYLGDIKTWDEAEKLLEQSLIQFGQPWELNPGDGAFYGPKIDITISDALRRRHQCATIQLDFQLPERFELQYRSEDVAEPMKRPVMIHRAILGSVERMIAILTENFAGRWPFWLSPRQVIVVPVTTAFNDYASKVSAILWDKGIYAEADLSGNTLPKKIRNAEIGKWNFIFVVGGEEESTNSVNYRNRDDPNSKNKGETILLDSVVEKLLKLKESKSNEQDMSN